MLQRADSALYMAKRGGRDRAVSFAAAGLAATPLGGARRAPAAGA
jgi:predicted signal transduction protein with EAL and GGDEF domain